MLIKVCPSVFEYDYGGAECKTPTPQMNNSYDCII